MARACVEGFAEQKECEDGSDTSCSGEAGAGGAAGKQPFPSTQPPPHPPECAFSILLGSSGDSLQCTTGRTPGRPKYQQQQQQVRKRQAMSNTVRTAMSVSTQGTPGCCNSWRAQLASAQHEETQPCVLSLGVVVLVLAPTCRPCGEGCPECLLLRLAAGAELPVVEVKHDRDACERHT